MSVVSSSLDFKKKVCVLAPPTALFKAEGLAAEFNWPLNPKEPEEFFFHLHVAEESLFVKDSQGRRLEIDFDQNHLDYDRQGQRGKNELIAKALGFSKGYRKILDLSVGMGIDSVLLTQLGFQVTGLERSPLLYVLLREAFARTQKNYLSSYQLYFSDGLSFLQQQRGLLSVDCIYFDPMYPHRKKSALPKQQMVVFRDLVGSDEDASEVLKEALSWPVQRVVVKRPYHADELLPGVRHSYDGKVVRYDTYVVG